MEEARKAVAIAKAFLKGIEPLAATDLRLEAVDDWTGEWFVILSYPDDNASVFDAGRAYREIKVQDGQASIATL